MKTKSFVIYCSPSGTVRHVAEVIVRTLKELAGDVLALDLGKERDPGFVLKQIEGAGKNICLYMGSPVYGGHAVPPVMEFIERLPRIETGFAVPFVTWGGVTSGVALWEMGKRLTEKGYRIGGAAKVGAVHSMLWQSETPLCQGHPDLNDDQVIAALAARVHEGLAEGDLRLLKLQDLDYQPEKLGSEMKKTSIEVVKQIVPPKSVDEEKCSQCNVCMEECPAGAIHLEPYPKFNDRCFVCFNCVRLCPENAIVADLSMIEDHIRQRKVAINELPLTQAFIG